jgi:uncharacterized protein GlcG (DUF336 family)
MNRVKNGLAGSALALLAISGAGPSHAQGQAPQAPQAQKNVSMRMAQAIIDGVLEQCTKDGYRVTVVIVDSAGQLHSALRGDGTAPHTMEFARRKAYTARTRNQTSLEFQKFTDDPVNAYLRQIPDTVAVGGGVPIRSGGVAIGGVGVSGAPAGEKDEVCANAGIAKVAEALK